MLKKSRDDRAKLKAGESPLDRDCPSPFGVPQVSYVASGTYQSPPCDWTAPARLAEFTATADLYGGQMTATVETSNDGFRTIASAKRVRVQDGVNAYSLDSLQGRAKAVRVRFELTRGPDAACTPVLDGFRITASPAN